MLNLSVQGNCHRIRIAPKKSEKGAQTSRRRKEQSTNKAQRTKQKRQKGSRAGRSKQQKQAS